ncbi:MAG: imidazole glycerol phosphate synthase subunit HisH [Deltaproteobacteria bacterium]|nr:imidazole glycerol phosphate synthase subunit HisH [Deltaproteobacteria bacterium]
MRRVAVIDYGLCNLDSIARALEECGGVPTVTAEPGPLKTATHIILPGVGAFSTAMHNLRQAGFEEVLQEQVVHRQIPFLGICLGMQMLAAKGYEGRETPGLGWIGGEVRRLKPTRVNERIPHVGWNEVHQQTAGPLFQGIPSGKDFYFVHSYHLCYGQEAHILATTPYCGGFISAVGRDLIFGVQFHPEKSQRLGFQVLRNFLSL